MMQIKRDTYVMPMFWYETEVSKWIDGLKEAKKRRNIVAASFEDGKRCYCCC